MPDSKRDTDVKNRFLDLVGEGEGGMIWENNIVTCILSYVEQIASPGSMYETGCSGLVHWDDPEGWDGEGGGRGGSWWGIHIHPCLIHVTVWQKPPQYCKVISLQLIKKKTQKEPHHTGSRNQTSNLQNCEKINFCWLSYLDCGILLWQSKLIKTPLHFNTTARTLTS